MHDRCTDKICPLCTANKKLTVNEWIHMHLTVTETGWPRSPWWNVEESNGDCYRALRGDLRPPGYYDQNPDKH